MSTPRDAPCPCGSGEKYEACCMPAEQTEGEGESETPSRVGAPASLVDAATSAGYWEADLPPIAMTLEEDPAARPAVALVVAAGAVLHMDIVSRPGGEAEDVAQTLERAILAAGRAVGVLPPEVWVRYPEVAAALEPLLERRDIRVSARRELPDLEEAARAFHMHLVKSDVWPVAPFPETWAGWGLSRQCIAEIFRAAAGFHRAEPWQSLASDEALEARFPDRGRIWTVSVLGQAGGAPGLALYASPEDFADTLALESPAETFAGLRERVISLHFDNRGELPRTMQREIAAAGWEVAAPDAYPALLVLNTPGGGIGRRDAADLIAILEALPRFLEATRFRQPPGAGEPPWVDGATGLELRFSPLAYMDDELDEPPGEPTDDDGAGPMPGWLRTELHGVLAELRAEGVDPDITELNARLRRRLDAQNQRVHPELGGLSPHQAQALLDDDWSGAGPLALAVDLADEELSGARVLADARSFLSALAAEAPLRHTRAGNLPRRFVASMIQRLDLGDPIWRRLMRESPRTRWNEQDVPPLQQLRFALEIAGLIRKYRKSFEVTRKGSRLLEEGRTAELYVILFRSVFRDLDLDPHYVPHEYIRALQYTLPLILWRLRSEAQEWLAPASLAHRVLPPPLRPATSERRGRAPQAEINESRMRTWGFTNTVIGPLVSFGLLESRSTGRGDTWESPFEVRKTPLYDRFLRWNL